ncbi:MAG: hypothetical protein CL943_01055 [Candidatus Diapherotrites archaeon]|uniref:Uncharacterized protein n=1 Tax=Candidatus Iainarchaeum sp. TaxID=3101447 RepID=A0A2D6M0G9_9ARCH|nr:hypothetical protein [Candidatus Diapherotrites archaeon]|tara:strand:- start:6110 stop:6295 length:186 start_codon:yes stop_codon:yes gene_type:complete
MGNGEPSLKKAFFGGTTFVLFSFIALGILTALGINEFENLFTEAGLLAFAGMIYAVYIDTT